MKKPKRPIEPRFEDYPARVGISQEDSPFVIAYKQYQKDMAKYEKDFELWQQLKFIRFIKNASEKNVLKRFKIVELNNERFDPNVVVKVDKVVFKKMG